METIITIVYHVIQMIIELLIHFIVIVIIGILMFLENMLVKLAIIHGFIVLKFTILKLVLPVQEIIIMNAFHVIQMIIEL